MPGAVGVGTAAAMLPGDVSTVPGTSAAFSQEDMERAMRESLVSQQDGLKPVHPVTRETPPKSLCLFL